jgi:hypothetical protein
MGKELYARTVVWFLRAAAAAVLLVLQPNPRAELPVCAFVCASAAWNAVALRGAFPPALAWVLAAVAVLYNPVLVVPLPDRLWPYAAMIAGGLLVVSAALSEPPDVHLPRYRSAFWLGAWLVAAGHFGLETYAGARLALFAPRRTAVIDQVTERVETYDEDRSVTFVALYRFEEGGRTYRGEISAPVRAWKAGDGIAIQYEPGDPTRNRAVGDLLPLWRDLGLFLLSLVVGPIVFALCWRGLRFGAAADAESPGPPAPAS